MARRTWGERDVNRLVHAMWKIGLPKVGTCFIFLHARTLPQYDNGLKNRLPHAGLRPFDFIDAMEWGGRPPGSAALI